MSSHVFFRVVGPGVKMITINNRQTKHARYSPESGFTIIEVLIAMVVFSIGILSVITMQTTSIGGNAKANYVSGGTNLAAERMEILMNLPYTSPLLEDPPTSGPGTDARSDGADNDGDGTSDETDEAYTVYDTSSDGIDNDNDGTIDEDSEYGDYAVQWRITTDLLLPNTKSINVTITSSLLQAPVNMDFIKAN